MARYINAERMREDWLENGENEYVYDTNAILESIDRQPTADVVEVVHGEWVDDTGQLDSVKQYKCSNCGKKPIVNMNWVTILSNYCPNCGAKMDGKKVE